MTGGVPGDLIRGLTTLKIIFISMTMTPDQEPLDPEDGFAEDVGPHGPLRRFDRAVSLGEAITQADGKQPCGSPGEGHNQDFLTYRGPEGLLQITLAHYPILATLWTLWARKRGGGEEAGVTAFEVAEALGIKKERAIQVLTSLMKAGAARQIARSTGYRGVRVQFYPTGLGEMLFALAATLGYGVQIQVGRTVRAWKTRSYEEPMGIFERFKLLEGRTL